MAERFAVMREDVSIVYAREHGATRTAATILNALTFIGSAQRVLILSEDGDGIWTLESSVVIPSNVTLSIPLGVTVGGTGNLTIQGGLITWRTAWFTSSGALSWFAGVGELQVPRLRTGPAHSTTLDLDAPLPLASGGTAATTAAAARTSLGLGIGTNVQAYDATLTALAGVATVADRLLYFTGVDTAAAATFTAFGRTLASQSDAASTKSALGLSAAVTGTGATGRVPIWDGTQTVTSSSVFSYDINNNRLGVNTVTPTSRLHVTGTMHNDTGPFTAQNVGVNTASGPTFSFNLQIFGAGTAGKPGGGSWSDTSTRAYKKNIRPFRDVQSPLETVLALEGKIFEWDEQEHATALPGDQMGFIAEEVEALAETYPLLQGWVKRTLDDVPSFCPIGFEALIIEAVRSLVDRLDALDIRLDALEQRR